MAGIVSDWRNASSRNCAVCRTVLTAVLPRAARAGRFPGAIAAMRLGAGISSACPSMTRSESSSSWRRSGLSGGGYAFFEDDRGEVLAVAFLVRVFVFVFIAPGDALEPRSVGGRRRIGFVVGVGRFSRQLLKSLGPEPRLFLRVGIAAFEAWSFFGLKTKQRIVRRRHGFLQWRGSVRFFLPGIFWRSHWPIWCRSRLT